MTSMHHLSPLQIGKVSLQTRLEGDRLMSLGVPSINGVPLRNGATRFLPWLDSFEGEVFRDFRLLSVQQRGDTTVLRTTVSSDPDVPFRERRDSSGDLCLRAVSWDAMPVSAKFDFCLEPVEIVLDGRQFVGFKYWFEYEGETPIHRLLDRQTWELGGNLDDVTICLRNWLTPPRLRLKQKDVYSTVGLEQWAQLLPGNLWGRWSLLPGFDMQYGAAGVLLGWFDEVSLIRTVVETAAGEDALRFQDLHYFEQSQRVRTNAKTIVYAPDVLDEVESLNLWTRLQDREYERNCQQFGMRDEGPPAIVFSQNQWTGFRFDKSYERVVDVAAEFGGDFVFIDGFWENGQALEETIKQYIPDEERVGTVLEKYVPGHMCLTYDFEVAGIFGGEEGLTALVQRAKDKGVGILGWMSTHYLPTTRLNRDATLAHGQNGIFAAKESGHHPDTGYAGDCWPANLNGPILEKIRAQILGVCQRTGVAGFLWDSFCNIGWWQVDYSDGSMRPQFDKTAALYADMVNAGLYILPEAVVSFSKHSCCGLHGGNVYEGDALGFAYNSQFGLHYGAELLGQHQEPDDWANLILTGKAPFGLLFRCFAHARVPTFGFHTVPREAWDEGNVAEIKSLFKAYKQCRATMQKRTVMADDLGVLWTGEGGAQVYFAFTEQQMAPEGIWRDTATGADVVNGNLRAYHVYTSD